MKKTKIWISLGIRAHTGTMTKLLTQNNGRNQLLQKDENEDSSSTDYPRASMKGNRSLGIGRPSTHRT